MRNIFNKYKSSVKLNNYENKTVSTFIVLLFSDLGQIFIVPHSGKLVSALLYLFLVLNIDLARLQLTKILFWGTTYCETISTQY